MRRIKIITFADLTGADASDDTHDDPQDCGEYQEGSFFLDVTATTGTSETLDVDIDTKDPVSGEWFTLTSFTQATGVTNERVAVTTNLGNKLSISYTIGGTTPTFDFTVSAILKS